MVYLNEVKNLGGKLMSKLKIKVESREEIGTTGSNRIRRNDLVPGVVYKRGDETKAIQVDYPEFLKLYREAGMTSVIDLELDGKTYPVIIKEVQKDPVKSIYTHVDFLGLNMDEKIKMFVPIQLVNRDSIKLQPSVLNQILDEVEMECLPGNIPSVAEVNVEDMTFDKPITVRDLDIVKLDDVEVITDLDEVVCSLLEPAKEEETDEVEEVDAAAVPLVDEKE